jgi:hypothetical protein
MILDVRSKPIKTMCDGIRSKLMVKYSGIRKKAAQSMWEITPHYSELLALSKRYSRDCTAKNADIGLWEVTSGPRTHAVNLEARTCGCKKWDLTGIPCNHAVAAIVKCHQQPEDYVHDFFKKPMYLEAYKNVIYPVPGEDEWPRTASPDIDPPVFREKPGRKQTVRRKGQFEVPAPKDSSRMGTITCSNCKLTGHRFTNCNLPLKADLQVRKDKQKVLLFLLDNIKCII